MTIRERLSRRKRKAGLAAYGGFALFALGLFLDGSGRTWLIMAIPGIVVFVAATSGVRLAEVPSGMRRATPVALSRCPARFGSVRSVASTWTPSSTRRCEVTERTVLATTIRGYAASWAARDRGAWLRAFAPDAIQEDPVGVSRRSILTTCHGRRRRSLRARESVTKALRSHVVPAHWPSRSRGARGSYRAHSAPRGIT